MLVKSVSAIVIVAVALVSVVPQCAAGLVQAPQRIVGAGQPLSADEAAACTALQDAAQPAAADQPAGAIEESTVIAIVIAILVASIAVAATAN